MKPVEAEIVQFPLVTGQSWHIREIAVTLELVEAAIAKVQ
jgi:hypothetical protein